MSVYFAYCPQNDMVKIGYSKDPFHRLRSLRSSSKRRHLHIRWIMEGDKDVEAELHAKYAHLKLYSEWFEHRGRLKQFLAKLPPAPYDKRDWLKKNALR